MDTQGPRGSRGRSTGSQGVKGWTYRVPGGQGVGYRAPRGPGEGVRCSIGSIATFDGSSDDLYCSRGDLKSP